MKKFLEIFLGILTAMGGFVEVGELTFSLNAGSKFGYRLLWVALVGTIGIIFFAEMAGRVACVRQKPVFDMIRQRIGFKAGLGTLVAANLVSLLTCAAEIGAVAIVLKLLIGSGPYRLWILLALLALLLIVWFLSFQAIERIFGLCGLLMLTFVIAAIKLKPDWSALLAGFVPQLPPHDNPGGGVLLYAYYAVALFSSILLPYETYFYASGMIEDAEKPSDVVMNRIIVIVGFSLGSLLAVALLVVGVEVFRPLNIDVEAPGTAAIPVAQALGRWGVLAALGGMLFAFSGAAIENALTCAYNLAQFFGWPWGKINPPRDAARFSLTWIVTFVIAALIVLAGPDPVQVVEHSIVLSVIILPLTYLPMLLVAGDSNVMGKYVNGWFAKTVGWLYFGIIVLAAAAAVPLLILTRGGKA